MAQTIADHHTGDHGTATASSGAATCNHTSFWITSESITTAAGSTYTLTLANSHVHTNTGVFASVALGASTTGLPQVVSVDTSTDGTVVIIVKNIHASAAFNGAIYIKGVCL